MVAIVSEKNKYVLVSCLNPLVVGEEFEKVPPHITVLPPFSMPLSKKEEFDRQFAEVAEDHLPFSFQALQPEMFGQNNDIEVMPVSTIDWGIFMGAFALAKRLQLDYDDTYHIKTLGSLDASRALSFGSGEEVDTCGGETCLKTNRPHITDFNGVINPGEQKHLFDVQLFSYRSFGKRVVSVYRNNMFDYD